MNELEELVGRAAAEQFPEAYFVGGCVRDALLREPVRDLDLVVQGDPEAFGRSLARQVGGHFFWLREQDRVARVILSRTDLAQQHVDLLSLTGTLEADLRIRDLTVNAMAVSAEDGLRSGRIIDPLGGMADLAARRLRLCRPDACEADPLRVLRALRFRLRLTLSVDDQTWALLAAAAPKLSRISAERIRDELFLILQAGGYRAALGEAADLGVFAALWPTAESPDAGRLVATLEALDGRLEAAPGEVGRLMIATPTAPRRRVDVLRVSALARTCGVDGEQAVRSLALSGAERALVLGALRGAPEMERLSSAPPATGRRIYRALQAADPARVDAVLLAGVEVPGLLALAADSELRPAQPLVTGRDVMRGLRLPAGPHIGEILQEIEEARADGDVESAESAVQWARRWWVKKQAEENAGEVGP